jgi:hypothetical protein
MHRLGDLGFDPAVSAALEDLEAGIVIEVLTPILMRVYGHA